jgi:hypothetical protein
VTLEEFEQDAIKDRLEGWELVEFLQIPIEQVLLAALENDWIDDDNIEDLLDFVGVKQ